MRHHRLPMICGIRGFSGPISNSLGIDTMIPLGLLFIVVNALKILAAYWLWQFRIDGAILGLILIGLSSIFWYGFFCSTRTPSWCGGNDSHRPYVVQLALIGNELLI